MGSAFRNVDNKLLHCRQGDVEGIGMRDQYIRGSFPQDLKGCDEADYCGINGGPEHCFARLKENEGGVLLLLAKSLGHKWLRRPSRSAGGSTRKNTRHRRML